MNPRPGENDNSDPLWFKIKHNNPKTPNMTGYIYKNIVETNRKSGLNETLQPKPTRQIESLHGFHHTESSMKS